MASSKTRKLHQGQEAGQAIRNQQAGFRFLFARSNGHDINLCEAADAALVLKGKTADGVDGFIKPFNPDRILGINGKNVKDVTANGKNWEGFDLIRAFISLFN